MEPELRTLAGLEERPGTVVVHLDDGEILEVAPGAIPDDMPGVGGSLGFPLLASLREAAARKLAARRLFDLVDQRLRSRSQLRRKLLDGGHAPEAVEAVLDQAETAGLVSDRAFAEAFCRDSLRAKAVGGSWLTSKLRDKGVAGDLAREVVGELLSREQERTLAIRAATGRWRRERGRDRLALARVQRFLASRGFPAAICLSISIETRPDDETPDASCNS